MTNYDKYCIMFEIMQVVGRITKNRNCNTATRMGCYSKKPSSLVGGKVFGGLTIFYLFLGGAGAGAVTVCCVADLLFVRQPFGFAAGYVAGPSASPHVRMIDCSFAMGFALLVAGIVCLLADLGRTDRVLSLFLNPHGTALTVGAYSLAILLFVAAFLALVRFLYIPEIPQAAIRLAEGIAIPVALVVMAYTGVLLQTVGGIAFWRTPLLPVLFVLSSLSSGIALVFTLAPLAGIANAAQRHLLTRFARADMVLIVLEALATIAFLLWASNQTHPAAVASYETITQGNTALAWWFGFMFCGMLVPFIAELTLAVMSNDILLRKVLAVVGALVLIGAICMRWAVVESGEFSALELYAVDAVAHANALLE